MNVRLFLPKTNHRHRQLLVDVVNTVDLQTGIVGAMGYQMCRSHAVISRGLALRPGLHWLDFCRSWTTCRNGNHCLSRKKKKIYLCQRQPCYPIQLSPELGSNQDQVLPHTEKIPLISNFLPLGKPAVHAIRQPAAAPPQKQHTIDLLISGLWFLHETKGQNCIAGPSLNELVMWTSPLHSHADERWQLIDSCLITEGVQ